jgi:CHAD domain-containing protein
LKDRVLKRGKAANISDKAQHKLRIALKNLRYGGDFFADVFGNRKRRRDYKRKMSALQELLGIRNDIVGAKTYLKELRMEADAEAERILSYIQGWYAREAIVADKAISKSWKKFKRAKDFWN